MKLQEVKQKLPAQYEKMVEMIPILHPGHSFFHGAFCRPGEKIPGQNNRQLSGIHVEAMQEKRAVICIDGGEGVGRVTKPGLDQQVGNAAINHVPREMIEKEVQEVCALADFSGELHITISVPDGERLAEQTFNPRLGIVGGISILGTSGIVEPMSSQALLDTIKVELNQKKAEGYGIAAVSPGNYGLDYMKKHMVTTLTGA